jgi:quercetin dioxygenase-like cupin family protein
MSETKERVLHAPLMAFSIADEIERLKQGAQWTTGSRNAITLAKTSQLRMVLVIVRKGATMHEHQVEGPLTLFVLAGAMRFTAGGEERIVRANGLLTLDKAVPHDVEALEEGAFLLTIMQPPQAARR